VKLRVLTLTIIASIPLAAQDPPYPFIQIYREQVKPGGMPKVVEIEEAAARFCAEAHCPNPYLAITSITGPTEICWINGFDAPESLEKVWHDYAANDQIMQRLNSIADQKAPMVFPAVNLLARYRDDLSFSANSTFAYARFISISVVQVRPGASATFEKARIALRAAQQRSARTQWVYQVNSGAEDGMYLVMTPGRTTQEIHLFGNNDDRLPTVAESIRDSVTTSETRLYSVSPSMSLPAPSWLQADPEFWKRP
jgi:hypothetical protein